MGGEDGSEVVFGNVFQKIKVFVNINLCDIVIKDTLSKG